MGHLLYGWEIVEFSLFHYYVLWLFDIVSCWTLKLLYEHLNVLVFVVCSRNWISIWICYTIPWEVWSLWLLLFWSSSWIFMFTTSFNAYIHWELSYKVFVNIWCCCLLYWTFIWANLFLGENQMCNFQTFSMKIGVDVLFVCFFSHLEHKMPARFASI